MIGMVSVSTESVRLAYRYLEDDDDCKGDALSKNKNLKIRMEAITDIINASRGKRKGCFSKSDKVKLLKLLKEVAYASYASSDGTLLLRIEMANIIQDIIKFYEGK